MRILQCVGDIDPALGGSVEAARLLAAGLHQQGHHPELVTLREPRAEWTEAWRGPVHHVGQSATRYLYNRRLAGWIASRACQFDAVVIHGLWRYTSAGVRRGLKGCGVPYFVFPHGMLDPYFERAFPWKHVQKSICWHAVESRVLRDARAVLFTSEEERRRARSAFDGYVCREQVVGLGVAPPEEASASRQAFVSKFPRLAGKRILLFLGRVHPKKGCDLLIRAFARAGRSDPRLQLVLAGPDECGWQASLIGVASQLGIAQRVTWTGPLYGQWKWAALRATEVLALPSHAENFGITVVEAMACSVPVLISREVNIWREIESDGAGFAAADDAEGTAAALERWLALPHAGRERMRENALRSFSSRFELGRFTERFVACLRMT